MKRCRVIICIRNKANGMNKIPRQVTKRTDDTTVKIIAITRFMRKRIHVSVILFFINTNIFFGDSAYSNDKFSRNNTDEAMNIRSPSICSTVERIAQSCNVIAIMKTALSGLRIIQGRRTNMTIRYGKDGAIYI